MSKKSTADNKIDNLPWVIFKSGDSLYAVSCHFVEAIISLQSILPVPVPGTPEYFRGAVNLRGTIYHVIDFRALLRKPLLKEMVNDFCQMIDQRREDHVHWLQELEDSIKEKREFKLTTDPHQCAFGKWYDSFKTKSVLLSSELRKLDDPHKKIHAIANQAKSLEAESRYDEASLLIENTRRHELSKLTDLLEEIKRIFQQDMREILLVLSIENKSVGLICDEVVSVEMLTEESETKSEALNMDAGFLYGISKRKKDNDLIIRINTEDFFLTVME